jgi:hypothetical protein
MKDGRLQTHLLIAPHPEYVSLRSYILVSIMNKILLNSSIFSAESSSLSAFFSYLDFKNGAHTASYPMSNRGSFPRDKAAET